MPQTSKYSACSGTLASHRWLLTPRLPTGIILMSPYVHRIARPETTIERADFPHQLMGAHLAEPYYRLVDLIDDYTSDTNCERLI